MTPKYLKQLCLEQKAYATPELNDKIYLHFKGFSNIENLEPYTGLRALWLEGNGIGKIKNLDQLVELRCLFLHQNCIEIIENLDALINLDTLNVANNLIKRIQGLSNLHKLKTLQIDHNYLRTVEDIAELAQCQSLGVLDMSFNHLDDPAIVEVFEKMGELTVLNIMSNPVIPKIANYRRTMVARLKKLAYLDDRPVFENERLATEAWAVGGMEAEREERMRQKDEERKAHDRNFEEAARLKRAEKYGPEEIDPVLEPKLQAFRDEMLKKIEDQEETSESDADGAVSDAESGKTKIETITGAEKDLLESIAFDDQQQDILNTSDIEDPVPVSNDDESCAKDSMAMGDIGDNIPDLEEHILPMDQAVNQPKKLSVHAWGPSE
ncbi:Dynein assembly factor 1, axonemal [Entophlyctis luteolus]|nr:Dynein assembly factor 1, axonemal [Entophlyctis luteolus]